MKDIPPHLFKLKEGATSTYCPRPNFSPSKAKLLDAWLDWALEDRGNGALVEPAPKTSWASRLILCPKYNPETPKDQPPDGIRVAWAGVQVNERLHKTVPTYPDPTKEMYKAARFKYKFSADGLKQYWSIPLDPATSEITSFWTHRGLFKFKRLVMGTKNAATVAQNAYTRALNTILNPRSRNNIANFADDFCGGADTIPG
jgi:hypothetical protein